MHARTISRAALALLTVGLLAACAPIYSDVYDDEYDDDYYDNRTGGTYPATAVYRTSDGLVFSSRAERDAYVLRRADLERRARVERKLTREERRRLQLERERLRREAIEREERRRRRQARRQARQDEIEREGRRRAREERREERDAAEREARREADAERRRREDLDLTREERRRLREERRDRREAADREARRQERRAREATRTRQEDFLRYRAVHEDYRAIYPDLDYVTADGRPICTRHGQEYECNQGFPVKDSMDAK